MRFVFVSGLVAVGCLLAADAVPPGTFVGHEKVAAALAKQGPIASGPDYSVSGSHREKAGQVEVHDKQTDVMYFVDGTATLVTGGKMVGGKVSGPGQWLGTSIEGGEERKVTKGDVVVVPAGTPHWFKEVPGPISYFVVKVLKP
jgi:glc operon protein GlcG